MSDLNQMPGGVRVPDDDGAADHLPGLVAPHVTLPSTSGESVALDDLGQGWTVLYIYPLTAPPDGNVPDGWDSIPGARGCTPEACNFRDHHEELLAAGATRVFGVSAQGTDYQREVVDRLRLPFSMLSDSELRLAAVLRIPTFRAGGMTLYKRITLLIRDGLIEHAFYPVFPPGAHAGEVLAWLRSASNGGCGA